jgi:hypothetical protein
LGGKIENFRLEKKYQKVNLAENSLEINGEKFSALVKKNIFWVLANLHVKIKELLSTVYETNVKNISLNISNVQMSLETVQLSKAQCIETFVLPLQKRYGKRRLTVPAELVYQETIALDKLRTRVKEFPNFMFRTRKHNLSLKFQQGKNSRVTNITAIVPSIPPEEQDNFWSMIQFIEDIGKAYFIQRPSRSNEILEEEIWGNFKKTCQEWFTKE